MTHDLTEAQLTFLTERHLATLTTLRANLSPHVVAVGFTYEPETGLVRIITRDGSVKVRNADRLLPHGVPNRAAVAQVDGGRWMTLEGPIRVSRDADEIADAERRYAARYRVPQPHPQRVVLIIEVDRVLGRA